MHTRPYMSRTRTGSLASDLACKLMLGSSKKKQRKMQMPSICTCRRAVVPTQPTPNTARSTVQHLNVAALHDMRSNRLKGVFGSRLRLNGI